MGVVPQPRLRHQQLAGDLRLRVGHRVAEREPVLGLVDRVRAEDHVERLRPRQAARAVHEGLDRGVVQPRLGVAVGDLHGVDPITEADARVQQQPQLAIRPLVPRPGLGRFLLQALEAGGLGTDPLGEGPELALRLLEAGRGRPGRARRERGGQEHRDGRGRHPAPHAGAAERGGPIPGHASDIVAGRRRVESRCGADILVFSGAAVGALDLPRCTGPAGSASNSPRSSASCRGRSTPRSRAPRKRRGSTRSGSAITTSIARTAGPNVLRGRRGRCSPRSPRSPSGSIWVRSWRASTSRNRACWRGRRPRSTSRAAAGSSSASAPAGTNRSSTRSASRSITGSPGSRSRSRSSGGSSTASGSRSRAAGTGWTTRCCSPGRLGGRRS